MTKKLKWNLKELPSGADLAKLVEQGVLTKEEARDMLVRESDEVKVDRDVLEDMKKQLEIMQTVLNELAKQSPTVIYKIYEKYTEPYRFERIQPYWMNTMNTSMLILKDAPEWKSTGTTLRASNTIGTN